MRIVVLLMFLPALAAADPWRIGAGLSLARDGSDASQDHPNPASFESSDYVLDYYGAIAEASRVSGHVRYRLFGGGGKIDSPISTHGFYVIAGGGIDLQVCRTTCFGIGLAASEQYLDYSDGGPANTPRPEDFHARFAALVVHASAYVTMPVADFSLTVRFGPRAKWIQNDDYPEEDDPQPGLGAELVLSRSL